MVPIAAKNWPKVALEKRKAIWLGLIAVIALAVLVRVSFLPDPLYEGDLEHFATWINQVNQFGLFQFYSPDLRLGAWDRPYPQLSTLSLDAVGAAYGHTVITQAAMADPKFIILLKLIPFCCELALIATVYLWLSERVVLRWLIPGILAIYPGLVVTSAWWGQWESPFVLFLALALIALHKKHPILSWALFAVAVLFKQPAVVMAPLMVVLTFRRYGLWRTVASIGTFAAIFTAFIIPFVLATSPRVALIPFLNASDAFPYLTNNAFNFWYVLETIHKGALPKFEDLHYADRNPLVGPFTFKELGLLMFGLYVLLLTVIMWRQAHQDREFVWATALFLGFFLLLTQVHERYIYPAAVLALVAIAQDRRMIWITVGTLWTFSYNVLGVAIPNRWPLQTFGLEYLALPTALLNVILLIALVWVALTPPPSTGDPTAQTNRQTPHLPETSIRTAATT